MSGDILDQLRSGWGPAECWHCGEWGCSNEAGESVPVLCDCEVADCNCHEQFDDECSCDCHAWRGIVREAAEEIERLRSSRGETATELERLRALSELLGDALEQMSCQNCDDRKCMDCVCRSPHDACADDCTECTPRERIHNPFVARHVQRTNALEAWRAGRS